MREFKRLTLMGMDFYVDYDLELGRVLCVKGFHCGRSLDWTRIVHNGVSLESEIKKMVGLPDEVKVKVEVKEPVKVEEVKEEVVEDTVEEEEVAEPVKTDIEVNIVKPVRKKKGK